MVFNTKLSIFPVGHHYSFGGFCDYNNRSFRSFFPKERKFIC
jgi:hypothetical protein